MRSYTYIFFLLTIVAGSCGSPQNEEIQEVLSKREQAFETKDVELYMSLISPEYSQSKDDNTVGSKEIRKSFLDTVGIFDTISISPQDTSIYDKNNNAEVVQVSMVDATIEESKSRFKIIDKIELAKIDGKWLIVKESEADLFKGFAFGGTN